MQIVTQTEIREYPLLSRGKVRDIYEIDPQTLLIVTTDRMSAFDVILPDPIPYKGMVLNQISIFWMQMFKDLAANHLIATDVSDYPADLQAYASQLQDRSILVHKARPLPVECIVRGYITGSGWKDYLQSGQVCGHTLPQGLRESDKLEQALFTPSTKAEQGAHDENITLDQARKTIGQDLFDQVEDLSLSIYHKAREYAQKQGLIIADTKFEFGLKDNQLLLIDEVLTPDSSRFWPMQGFTPGKSQPSFDKQYLRDWLQESGWDKNPPAPKLPQEVIQKTQEKYLEAYKLLTGQALI